MKGNNSIKKINYKKGFEIMMEHFNDISDEVKSDVDKKLKKLGL